MQTIVQPGHCVLSNSEPLFGSSPLLRGETVILMDRVAQIAELPQFAPLVPHSKTSERIEPSGRHACERWADAQDLSGSWPS